MLPIQQSTHSYTKPITGVFKSSICGERQAGTSRNKPVQGELSLHSLYLRSPRDRPVGKRQDGKNGLVPCFYRIGAKTPQELKKEVCSASDKWRVACKLIKQDIQQQRPGH